MPEATDLRLKRCAVQLAAQMPESRAECLKVIEYLAELVEWETEPVSRPALELIG